MIPKQETSAKKNPLDSMSEAERKAFLFDLPNLLDGWYTGLAMGQKYQVNAAFDIKWGTKAFRTFLEWALFLNKKLPHKNTTLYRMLALPLTDKKQFKLRPGLNPLHSWTSSLKAAEFLFKLAYKGRSKTSKNWSYLIVKTEMPGKRIAINYDQSLALTKWVLKNQDRLYSMLTPDKELYSKQNFVKV